MVISRQLPRLTLTLFTLFLLVVFTQTASFAKRPRWVSDEDAAKMMPVEDISRDMRGVGLTVFQGTKIEKFDFVVLGILEDANLGGDLILVRIGGGPITKRDTGVLSGMSGSPCYIGGKLIGAIAYGPRWSKEPICMITPIYDMLEAWDKDLPDSPRETFAKSQTSQVRTVAGRKVAITGGSAAAVEQADGVLYMEPLAMPLSVTGMSQRGVNRLAEALSSTNIRPVFGGGKRRQEETDVEFVPGAAIGAAIVTGDIDLTGVGTLTYKRGDKVLGFGHPFMSLGAIQAPMTTAYIEDILSGYLSSTKLSTPIKTIGSIVQDREYSIAGVVGKKPATVPVTSKVHDLSTKREKTFKLNIVDHPLVTQMILPVIVGESAFIVRSAPGYTTAQVKYTADIEKIGRIERSDVFFAPDFVDIDIAMELMQLMHILRYNKFQPVGVKSLDIDIQMTTERKTASIERIYLDKKDFKAGEVIDVHVDFRPYKQPVVTKTYKIEVPASVKEGKMVLIVRGGATSGGMDDSMADNMPAGPPSVLGPEIANATSLEQMVEKFVERDTRDQIVFELKSSSSAVNVAGEKFEGLPQPYTEIMKDVQDSALRVEQESAKTTFDTDNIILGAEKLQLTVVDSDMSDKRKLKKGNGNSSSKSVGPRYAAASTLSFSQNVSSRGFIALSDDEMQVDANGDNGEDMDETSAGPEDEGAENEQGDVDEDSGEKGEDGTSSGVKTVVRQPKTWRQDSQPDFIRGIVHGVAATDEGRLVPAPVTSKVCDLGEDFVWDLCAADGRVYAATGNSGNIYEVSGGEPNLYFATGELQVMSLAVASNGRLYAATAPFGKVYEIEANGKGRLVFDSEYKYATAIEAGPDGNVYVGFGDSGKVYVLKAGGAEELCTLPSHQVLDVEWSKKHGMLLAATGVNAVCYGVYPDGKVASLMSAKEETLTSVVCDSEGNIYAASAPKGGIYKLDVDGRTEKIYSDSAIVKSMVVDGEDNLYAAAQNMIVRVGAGGETSELDGMENKASFISLAFCPSQGKLYLGTSATGEVYSAPLEGGPCEFESAVHDAGQRSRWQNITCDAGGEEDFVTLALRTGNSPEPDKTWSEWTGAEELQLYGIEGRYAQYKVQIDRSAHDLGVDAVSVTYMPPNTRPIVKMNYPKGGEFVSKEVKVRWSGADPDRDKLVYSLYYSTDGNTWNALTGDDAEVDMEDEDGETEEFDPTETAKLLKDEVADSEDVPEDLKQKVGAIKIAGGNDKPGAGSSRTMKNTSYKWDTTKVEDGTYWLKVVASDELSNATGALSEEVASGKFMVANTSPGLEVTIEDGKIVGVASAQVAPVTGVEYRIDKGDWQAAIATDGAFGSLNETFSIDCGKDAKGKIVEVRAVDAAGNAKTEEVDCK